MRLTTRKLLITATACMSMLVGTSAFGHCEIPCGIYGDRMRVEMVKEHCQTLEKSMKQIKMLEGADKQNANQLVRWVVNKDEHANKIQGIVYQYFMNQRIKPVDAGDTAAYRKYVKQITLLHKMLVASMKCKQTTNEAYVEELRTLLTAFEKVYFTEEENVHSH